MTALILHNALLPSRELSFLLHTHPRSFVSPSVTSRSLRVLSISPPLRGHLGPPSHSRYIQHCQRPRALGSSHLWAASMAVPTVPSPKRHQSNHHFEKGSTKQSGKSLPNVFIGSIDQGTTSSRFLIFDKSGTPVASHQIEFTQYYPHSGWVIRRAAIRPRRGQD